MSSEAYKRIRIINARARALKVVRSVTRALTVDVVNDAISFLPLAAAAVGSGPRTHGRARSDAQASKLKDCIGRASLLVNIAFMSWLSARDLTKDVGLGEENTNRKCHSTILTLQLASLLTQMSPGRRSRANLTEGNCGFQRRRRRRSRFDHLCNGCVSPSARSPARSVGRSVTAPPSLDANYKAGWISSPPVHSHTERQNEFAGEYVI